MKRKREMIDFTSDIVHVKCGGSDKLTHIHRSLLEKMIGPLEVGEMIWGDFDPNTNKLDLSTDAQHDGFQLIAQWLYTGEMGLADEASESASAVIMLTNAYRVVCCLTTPSDDQGWHNLLNKIMDHLLDRIINCKNYGAAITVELLSEVLKDLDGPPTVFITDWLVRGNLTSNMEPWQFVQLFDGGLKHKLLQRFFEQRLANSDTPPWEEDPCEYHLHVHLDESEQCQARASAARMAPEDCTIQSDQDE
ncbi:hypothetical protein KC333_g4919 [Hortaea werneckii]|nr:hypothetical protein KC333_g4919 [Hortaea werneckii]KAI7315005.1 hypothetical protein KC326_g4860 [Hortaea werneckii]